MRGKTLIGLLLLLSKGSFALHIGTMFAILISSGTNSLLMDSFIHFVNALYEKSHYLYILVGSWLVCT